MYKLPGDNSLMETNRPATKIFLLHFPGEDQWGFLDKILKNKNKQTDVSAQRGAESTPHPPKKKKP